MTTCRRRGYAVALALALGIPFTQGLDDGLICPSMGLNYITPSPLQQCPAPSPIPDLPVAADRKASAEVIYPKETIFADAVPGHMVPSSDAVLVALANTNDGASPLDEAKFLSFEEWKAKNLQRAGRADRLNHEVNRRVKQSQRDQQSLDSLGDDMEIDLDFSQFTLQQKNESAPHQPAKELLDEEGNPHGRSKDAGKTWKERFNYASLDCAATILKSNAESKGAISILVENKDSYMLNPCNAENKFFIVDLCTDILVDTVVLGNYEFFSSMFRTLRVSVSDRYPVKGSGWKELGIFEAQNTRGLQAFSISNPLIWARYLRIELLTHYGSEFYCPMSLLRVHGTTMMEEYKHQDEAAHQLDSEESGPQEIQTHVPSSFPATVSGSMKSVETMAVVAPSQFSQTKSFPHANGSVAATCPAPTSTPFSFPSSIYTCPANSTMGSAISPNHTTSSMPPSANPTTQESIYKNIMKRLSLLESNASLSLQYIEEQSWLLRDAFSQMERKQSARSALFIEQLNMTVLAQLQIFSTVLQLESQFEQSGHGLLSVRSRLSLLTDEVIFQRRMSIVQSLLLLATLAFVFFTRGTYVDLSWLPRNKSRRSLWRRSRHESRSRSLSPLPVQFPGPECEDSRPHSAASVYEGSTLAESNSATISASPSLQRLKSSRQTASCNDLSSLQQHEGSGEEVPGHTDLNAHSLSPPAGPTSSSVHHRLPTPESDLDTSRGTTAETGKL